MAVQFPRHRTKRNSAGNGMSRFEAEIRAEIEMNGFLDCHKTDRIPYEEKHTYIPDFQLPNGILIETKGYFPDEDRVKMRSVKASHPELDIRFIFLNPKGKCTKGGKMTYAEWADKHGFPWASKHLPIEWLYEKKESEKNT